MFKVHVNDGTAPIPEDDICYIVAKEGIFLKKKMGIMDSIAPVKNISILESVSASAQMHIPPIPAVMFAKVIDFFKQVYTEYRGEAIVLLFYNEETQKYKIVPPAQKVSAASLDYNRSVTIEGYTMIGDIHSHGSMSAFHSGVDDKDEESFDGLHITVGNANNDEVSLSGSIVANGYRFMVDPADYLAGIKLTKDEDKEEVSYSTKVYRSVNGKLELDTKASKPAHTYRKLDKRYISIVPPSKRKVGESWMNKVEKGTYVYTYGYHAGRSGGYGYGGYGGYGGKRWENGKWVDVQYKDWGSHYDSHAWQKYHKVGEKPPVHAIPPVTKQADHIFPAVDKKDDKETIPCLTCLYRDEKILLEESDDLDNEFYVCTKCGQIISGDSDELTCPDCKTDIYLLLIEDKDLKDNSVEIEEQSTDTHIFCPQCAALLMPEDYDDFCPYCFSYIYNSEETIEKQMESDSGAMLDPEADAANEAALHLLTEPESKIPDPEKDTIPIPVPKATGESLLKTMFSKVFRGDN